MSLMTSSLRSPIDRLTITVLSLIACASLAYALPAMAQPAPAAPSVCTADTDCKGTDQKCESGVCVYKLSNPLRTESIPELVGRVITIFTGVSGSLALLMFIYGGFMWIFSGGNPDRVQKGRDVMKWAVIGLAIMFGAYALVTLVFKGFGI